MGIEKYVINEDSLSTLEKVIAVAKEEGRTFESAARKLDVTDKAVLKYGQSTELANMDVKHFTESINQMNTSFSLSGIMSKAGAVGLNIFKTALASIGIGLAVTGISLLIGKLVQLGDSLITTRKEIGQFADTARDNVKSIKTELDNSIQTVEDVKTKYAQLSQGVDDFSKKNISLSNDDYDEFLKISNQLAETFPELVDGYDDNGNALLNLRGNVGDVITTFDELIKKERELANIEIAKNIPALYKEAATNAWDSGDSYAEQYKNFLYKLESYYYDGQEILFDISDLSEQQKNAFSKILEDKFAENGIANPIKMFDDIVQIDDVSNIEPVINSINKAYDEIEEQINERRHNIDLNPMKEELSAFLATNDSYLNASTNAQQTIQKLLFNSNWSYLASQEMDTSKWSSQLQNWITANYVDAIASIDDHAIQNKLSLLFDQSLPVDSRLNIAEQLQQYFDENDIKISLDFVVNEDDEDSLANLKNRVEQSVNKFVTDDMPLQTQQTLQQEIDTFFKDNKINTESAYNQWLKAVEGANSLYDAMRQFKDPPSTDLDFFTTDNLTLIKEYKDKITDLNSYLFKARKQNIQSDDMIELAAKYKIVADSQEEYEKEIERVIRKETANSAIIKSLAKSIQECTDAAEKARLQTVYDSLIEFQNKAATVPEGFSTLQEAISTLQAHANIIREVRDDIKEVGYITSSQFDDIVSAYPQLSGKVIGYNKGTVSATELFNSLTEAYKTDEKNYSVLVSKKFELDEKFYSNFKKNVPEWLNSLAKAYNIDFENCKNLLEAKLQAEQEYAKKVELLHNIIAQNDEFNKRITGVTSDPTMGIDMATSIRLEDDKIDVEKETEDLQSIIDGIDTTITSTLNLDTDWKKFGKERDDTKNYINWIENSIKNVQREVDKLQTKLSNAKGYKAQSKAIKSLNEELLNLKSSYSSASAGYTTNFNKSNKKLIKMVGSSKAASYVAKIKSGSTFEKEKFAGKENQKLYELLNDMIEDYQSSQDYKVKAKDIDNQILNNTITGLDNKHTHLSKQLDVINTKLNSSTLTVSQKNKLLDQQLKKQQEINDTLREKAILENDLATISKLNQEDENNKINTELGKLENEKNSIDKKVDYYTKASEDTTKSYKSTTSTIIAKRNKEDEALRVRFEEEIAKLGETRWNNYLTKLKTKYKETKMDDKKFIEKHLGEIAKHFQGDTDLGTLYLEHLANQTSRKAEDYKTYTDFQDVTIGKNENKIADIQNKISLNNDRGTKQQYTDISQLETENLAKWQERLKYATEMRNAQGKNTLAWIEWDNEIQKCDNAIKSCNENIKNCGNSILQLPLNDINDQIAKIDLQLATVNDEINTQNKIISAANGVLDAQIYQQNKLKEVVQDQIDELQREKTLRDANLAVSKAEYNLEKLKNQKTTKVFKNGGWIYEADEDALRNAQTTYDDALTDQTITMLNDQIHTYDLEITRLNRIKDEWGRITTDAQLVADLMFAKEYDEDFISKVLKGDLTMLDEVKTKYSSLFFTQDSLNNQKDRLSLMSDLISKTIELNKLSGQSEEATEQEIMQIIGQYYPTVNKGYEDLLTEVETYTKKSSDSTTTIQKNNNKLKETYQDAATVITEQINSLTNVLDGLANKTSETAKMIAAEIKRLQQELSELPPIAIPAVSVGASATKAASTKVGKSHSGMELGYIGESKATKDAFKLIALDQLKSDEVLRVLQKGEAVLTKGQIQNVVSNFKAAAITPTLPSLLKTTNTSKSVTFNGDIIVKSEGDVNGLANAIKMKLPNAMLQEIYK